MRIPGISSLLLISALALPGRSQAPLEALVLKPTEEIEESRFPLACELRLSGNPTHRPVNAIQTRLVELLEGRYRLRYDGAKLDVDEQGTGQVWRTLPSDKPARIELQVGGTRWPLIFWRERGLWFAASAEVRQAQHQGAVLQSLDADLDGRHLGEFDWLRLGDGGWYLCGKDPLVQSKAGLVGLRDVSDPKSVRFSCAVVPVPSGVNTGVQVALAEFNTWRMAVGHSPVRIHLERTLALQKHALYVATAGNDGDLLAETPGRAGYTVEGDAAAKQTSIFSPTVSAIEAIRPTFLSAYNRANFLNDPEEGFAAASMLNSQPERHGGRPGYTWLATGRAAGMQLGVPRIYPAPGQVGVPPVAMAEWPVSEDRPDLFATDRGTAVAAYFGGATWTQVEITLLDQNRRPVKGECYTPEKPAAPKKGQGNHNAVFFWPSSPLQPRTRYTVELRAVELRSNKDESILLTWSFVTGKG